MRQKRGGAKVINWHRPLRKNEQTRRYRRCRQEGAETPRDRQHELTGQWERDDCWDYEDSYDHLDYFRDDPLTVGERLFSTALDLLGRTRQRSPLHPEPHDKVAAAVKQEFANGDLTNRLRTYIAELGLHDDSFAWPSQRQKEFEAGLLAACKDSLARLHVNPWGNDAYAVATCLLFFPFWTRCLLDWNPHEGDEFRRIDSLVNHLFVEFPVPPFLIHNLVRGEDTWPRMKWVCWLILLGQGASLHQMGRVFGWRIPRRFSHYLRGAPEALSGVLATMWAEIHRLGGSRIEVRALSETPAYVIDLTEAAVHRHEPRLVAFWRNTVRWLTRHRHALNDRSRHEILQWAFDRFAEGNFSWKGRSPVRAAESAREHMEALRRHGTMEGLAYRWASKQWNWTYRPDRENEWSVTELLSGVAIHEEGRAMCHCVGSYVSRCVAHRSAIFSLCLNGRRLLTIEVDPARRALVQMRGPSNRSPTAEERQIVETWWRDIVSQRAESRTQNDGSG